MTSKHTMTLNLSDREMSALHGLAAEMDISKTAVLRSALKLYQLVHVRLRAGEQFMFSGDQKRVVEFIGPGFGEPSLGIEGQGTGRLGNTNGAAQ